MRHEIVFVTPAIARGFLENNVGNRPVRKVWVNQLASLIERGEWQVTHQGVAISKSGRLLDGQHRLLAIEASGIPCHMNISFDVSDDAFLAIDTGAKRNTNDIFRMGSFQAETIRFAAKLITPGVPPTPKVIEAFIGSRFHQATDALYDYCPTSVKIFSAAPMRFAAVYLYTFSDSHAMKEVVFKQYRALCLHDFEEMDTTSRSFVKTMLSTGKKDRIDQTSRFAYGLKALNPTTRDYKLFRCLQAEMTSLTYEAKQKIRNELSNKKENGNV